MRNRILIYLCAFVGVLSALTYSCKKSDDTNPPGGNTVTDIDGNVYHTVTLGTQVWLVENLKVTHYRNGDPIQPGTLKAYTTSTVDTAGKVYVYNDLSSNADIYGRLYNWYALGGSHTLAPNGCHVPSVAEWDTLSAYLHKTYGTATSPDFGEIGGVLKETGTIHWQTPNTGATNESGFSALPGGGFSSGAFVGLGSQCFFWTSNQVGPVMNTPTAWSINLNYSGIIAYHVNPYKLVGISVRCLKD
jgi:uncharacterized protein (TIGR02145 family)